MRDEPTVEAKTPKFYGVRGWRKWAAIATACALILSIGLLIPRVERGEKEDPKAGAILDVVYPKAYAFDDFDAGREVREQNPVEASFIEALNEFSYKTSPHILTRVGENTNYSPLSLYYALSLAASGAQGETEAELFTLLGVPSSEILTKQCGNLYRTLYRENTIGKFKIANSLWLANELNGEPVTFKEDFVKQAAADFYASSHKVNFSKAETGKAMVDWIATNTNGTLAPTIETDPGQIFSILNTVYFHDEWVNRFEKSKTAKDVFHLSNGDDVTCSFMNATSSSAGYAIGEGFTRASIGLKNAGQMIFILPDVGVSPYSLLATQDQMRETFAGGQDFHGIVTWKLPKFSFSSKLTLANVLQELGVVSAFAADADFSRITDRMASVSEVQQNTYIAIDENGVEASAFTEVRYVGAAPPEGRADMILDRPFIYGITAQNGVLLFVGVCENPTK